MTSVRLAVLADFPEEGWPSMDLCADMLLAHLPPGVDGTRVCPTFTRFATRLPLFGRRNTAFNADRLLNRFVTFPAHLRRVRSRFDYFHLADHTYAHLVHDLPADRTGVFCHDLDAFRSLIEPARDPRPRWFRWLARRILTGMQKAAVVFHSTHTVRDELTRFGLVDPARLVHASYGVAPEFTPDPPAPPPKLPWLDALAGTPWVLHVGSCVPRKRVDLLLDVVAAARKRIAGLNLVKVGGEWTAAHREQIAGFGLSGAIVHVTGLSRAELAEVYRRAPVVLVPSEAEGFGLPVIEALACGAAVVASDIPVLREVGGPACGYAEVGALEAWVEVVLSVLCSAIDFPDRLARLARAAQFGWNSHAALLASAYSRSLLALPPSPDRSNGCQRPQAGRPSDEKGFSDRASPPSPGARTEDEG